MKEIRELIRALIYSLAGIIIFILAVRLLLDVTNLTANLVWYRSFSDFFMSPFANVVDTITIGRASLDLTVLFAMFSYLMLASLLEQLLLTFFWADVRLIFIEIIVSIFKLFEYLLLYRIVIKLFEGPGVSSLKTKVYAWSDKLVAPLDFIPAWQVGVGAIDLAALVLLILIVMLDLFVEMALASLLMVGSAYRSRKVIYRVQKVIMKNDS